MLPPPFFPPVLRFVREKPRAFSAFLIMRSAFVYDSPKDMAAERREPVFSIAQSRLYGPSPKNFSLLSSKKVIFVIAFKKSTSFATINNGYKYFQIISFTNKFIRYIFNNITILYQNIFSKTICFIIITFAVIYLRASKRSFLW